MFRWHRVLVSACLLSALAQFDAPSHCEAQCPNDKIFGGPLTSSTFSYPGPSAVGDLNGDGIPDMVVGTGAGSFLGHGLAVLLGEPTLPGTFQPPFSVDLGQPFADLAVGDFNGDGIPDIAATSISPPSAESGWVYIVLGLGNGEFPSDGSGWAVQVGASPRFLKSIDINHDGYDDLVLIAGSHLTVLMATGDPETRFSKTTDRNVGPVTGLSLADLNGDGIADVLVPLSTDRTLVCYYGQGVGGAGDGTFGGDFSFSTGAASSFPVYDPAVADINLDGAKDVVVADGANAWLYLGTLANGVPTGSFAKPYAISISNGPTAIAPPVFGEFNHDGRPDLVVPCLGGLSIMTGQSNGQLSSPTFVPVDNGGASSTYANNINVADFTLDGAADVSGTNGALTGQVWVLPNICSFSSAAPPALVAVEDVPLDQGGRVKVSWARAGEDVPNGKVQTYWLWRSVPAKIVQAALSAELGLLVRPSESFTPTSKHVFTQTATLGQYYFWEYVGSEPAARLSGYSYVAGTTNDSTGAGNPLTAFFVQARNTDGTQTWESSPDSGYSVDNLPPNSPTGLAARFTRSNTVRLHWNPNHEADLSHYELFRGSDQGFPQSSVSFLGTATDTLFTDIHFVGNGYYKVTAVDIHGNSSGSTVLGPQQISGVELAGAPSVGYLRQNYPNPFNPNTTLEYGVSAAGTMTLRVYDMAGHLIRTLVGSYMPVGRYTVTWDGRSDRGDAVASGIYVADLVGPESHETRRMALIR